MPPGEGLNVPLQVGTGATFSAPVLISYAPPTVLQLFPNTMKTNGSVVQIHGLNFGTEKPSVTVGGEEATVLDFSQSDIFIRTPSGEGSTPVPMVISVAGQLSCQLTNGGQCGGAMLTFLNPVINAVDAPDHDRSTEGNFIIRLEGENFGRPATNIIVKIDELISCQVINHTHSQLYCIVGPGAGGSLPVTVSVANNVGTKSSVLSYSPPYVRSVSSLSGDASMIPTAGFDSRVVRDDELECSDGRFSISTQETEFLKLYFNADSTQNLFSITQEITMGVLTKLLWKNIQHWSRQVYISVIGSNFGMEEDIMVNLNDGEQVIVRNLKITFRNHTHIVLQLSPGEGRLHLDINVRGQSNEVPESVNHMLTFSPPIIDKIEFLKLREEGYLTPTSGCNEFVTPMPADAQARVCKPNKKAQVVLKGANFGGNKPVVIWKELSHAKTPYECVISSFSHHEIIFELPPGQGKVAVEVRITSPGLMPRSATTPSFFYSAPDVHRVSWGKAVESAWTSWSYNAQGTALDVTRNKLYIFGDNFGSDPSPVTILVDGKECSAAKYNSPSLYSSPPGAPFLSCEPSRTTVGPKVLKVTVAFQTIELNGSSTGTYLSARCFPGSYGKYGEYCVECWKFESEGRILDATSCTGEYVAGKVRNVVDNVSFANREGSVDPVPFAGFATFPPPECVDGLCIPTLSSGANDIPEECVPQPGDGDKRSLVLPAKCEQAEVIGIICHPDRFGGYCTKGKNGVQCFADDVGLISVDDYDMPSIRHGCMYATPCKPKEACEINNTCKPGYVNYYKPYRYEKAVYDGVDSDDMSQDNMVGKSYVRTATKIEHCNIGHLTLPDGTCYAPRCGLCTPKTHFRLDGYCTLCPEYPWLIPVALTLGAILGGAGAVILSRSGVSFAILNISVDYFQVLSLFAGSRVEWPAELSFLFKYLRIFAVDVDLAAPECMFDNFFTFETKFYFKMLLPILFMGMLLVFVLLVFLKRVFCTKTDKTNKQNPAKKKRSTRVKPGDQKESKKSKPKPKYSRIEPKKKKDHDAKSNTEDAPAPMVTSIVKNSETKLASATEVQSDIKPMKEKKHEVSQNKENTPVGETPDGLDLKALLSMVVSLFLTLVYFLYLTITRAALDVFNCEPTEPPSGKMFMSGAPLEECGVKGGLQERIKPTASFFLFFYTMGFPVAVLFIFVRYRTVIKEDQTLCAHGREAYKNANPHFFFRKKVGKLYYPFKPEFYWWTLVILARKILLVLAAVMIRSDSGFQLSCVLCFMFIALCSHIEFDPYMHIQEKAAILRREAEERLRKEFRKVHVMHFMAELSQSHMSRHADAMQDNMQALQDNIENIEKEIEMQDKIAHKLHRPIFNYNNIEFVVLACSVLVPLTGIMFNSQYLNRSDNYFKKRVVTYGTIVLVFASLLYLFVCIIHEARNSREFKRQRSLLLWSRLRIHRATVVKTIMQQASEEQRRLARARKKKRKRKINMLQILRRIRGKTTEHSEVFENIIETQTTVLKQLDDMIAAEAAAKGGKEQKHSLQDSINSIKLPGKMSPASMVSKTSDVEKIQEENMATDMAAQQHRTLVKVERVLEEQSKLEKQLNAVMLAKKIDSDIKTDSHGDSEEIDAPLQPIISAIYKQISYMIDRAVGTLEKRTNGNEICLALGGFKQDIQTVKEKLINEITANGMVGKRSTPLRVRLAVWVKQHETVLGSVGLFCVFVAFVAITM